MGLQYFFVTTLKHYDERCEGEKQRKKFSKILLCKLLSSIHYECLGRDFAYDIKYRGMLWNDLLNLMKENLKVLAKREENFANFK